MRGLKSLLVLVAVLAGLGAYIYFVEWKKPNDAGTAGGPKVFSVTSDAIEEVAVKSAGGDRTRLRRTGGSWQIVEPVAAAADEAEISGIVSSLATLDTVRTVDDSPPDLGEFGLAEPRVEIEFKTAGSGQAQRLLIGDKTATSGDLYAKLPNEKRVFLIPGYLDATFNRGTFDLRSKTVLVFERDKVDHVSVQSAVATVELARAADEWALTRPIQAPADYGSVEGLIGRVQSAQMKAIVADDPRDLKTYGLDRPAASVTFGLGSSRATLLLGAKTESGAVYARDASRPMVFTVDSTLLDEVNKPAADLRRKDLFAFRAFNATSIEITRGSDTLAFEKIKGEKEGDAEKWRQTRPAAKDVEASAFDSVLTKLSNLRAQSFVEAGAKTRTGLDSPVMVVTVRFDDGKKEEKVTFGRAGGDTYAAMSGQPGAAKIDAAEFDEAVKALDALK